MKEYRGNSKGLFFIVCFRIAHFFTKNKLLYIIGCPVWILYRIIFNFILGVDISEGTKIGKKFILRHGMGLAVHPSTIIGNNVTLRHNTTIGNSVSGGGAPIIEDDVNVGANSVIIGEITIGKGATIGAGSVVIKDVPAYAVVVGNPARIVKINNNQNN